MRINITDNPFPYEDYNDPIVKSNEDYRKYVMGEFIESEPLPEEFKKLKE